MRQWIDSTLQRFHRGESGAVMLLLLAAFLILFMVAMTLYDAGQSAQDKMDAQISADASAFSHSVIKSRSMNMIAYANIIKRMYWSFAVTYTNGFIALLLTFLEHTALCAKVCCFIVCIWCPRLRSCWELVENVMLYLSEFVEAVFDFPALSIASLTGDRGFIAPELEALERYQQYMIKITPWWAWGENIARSMNNGAMTTATWPPPAANILESVANFATSTAAILDFGFGSDFMSLLPSQTNAVDALPLARRDKQTDWSDSYGPFDFSYSAPSILANAEYCLAWVGSMEFLVHTIDTYRNSSSSFEWFRPQFLFFQLLAGGPGCLLVNIAYSLRWQSMHLDYKINTGAIGSDNDWLQSTSNVTFSYVPHGDRNSNTGDRQKFSYLDDGRERTDANLSDLMKNEGYFSMARSEVVYKPSVGTDNSFFNAISEIPMVGARLGFNNEPDMWSPRWTAKLRPVNLPGEQLAAATDSDGAGMNSMVTDTMPYMILGSGIGALLSGENYTLNSTIDDLFYLWRASRTFTDAQNPGLVK